MTDFKQRLSQNLNLASSNCTKGAFYMQSRLDRVPSTPEY